LRQFQSFAIGSRTSDFIRARLVFITVLLTCSSSHLSMHAAPSIARIWDERALAAIRADTPHPPAQARDCFSLAVAMYDAWAAYDPLAVGYVYRAKHTATDVPAARREAISYAAWRLLKERHGFSRTAETTLAADDALMTSLGFNTNEGSRDTTTPAGVGNSVYDAVSAWFINDGANQAGGIGFPFSVPPIAYPDYPASQGGYVYLNPALVPDLPGIDDGEGHTVADINHWQRLRIPNAIDQNGFPLAPLQKYLGAQWLLVRPFALERVNPADVWIDPGPPPWFGGPTHTQFVKEAVAVIAAGSQLDPGDDVLIDISPCARGNNSLEFAGDYGDGNFEIYDGHGYTNNPVTGQPYPSYNVKRGDYARVLAEFWADGPSSETPPGHWNLMANYLADHPLLVKRIGGVGPVVDDLEWDLKMYFALNAAVHDAACAAWGVKRYYDGWRPISAVRYLAELGQCSDQGLPAYNANGLPLITNLIELVTSASVAAGRHTGLTPGKIAVRAWPGPPPDPTHNHSGVKWLHGESWRPYQRTNFVTPAFPGYVSGHSSFSRAAAEVLTAFTGSPFFPGGLGTYTNFALQFEEGPSETVSLQWATYYDAADEAGISRLWGGIHAPIDNLEGRRIGSRVGKAVWALARRYFDGKVADHPIQLAMSADGPNGCELRFNTIRGLYYTVHSTTNLNLSFTNEPVQTIRAVDSSTVCTAGIGGTARFYRVTGSLTP
jgi:hypothetical protein